MNPSLQRMADGLRKAIQAEREGQHFYRMAAQITQDAQGRSVFEELAEDERIHEEFLRRHYDSVLKDGRLASGEALVAPAADRFAHPIFSADLRKRAAGAHYEMTALSIGIQLEESAVRFYEGEAKACENPAAKEFYKTLVTWEQGHLSALQRQADAMKEEYWGATGFAPF